MKIQSTRSKAASVQQHPDHRTANFELASQTGKPQSVKVSVPASNETLVRERETYDAVMAEVLPLMGSSNKIRLP